MRTQGTSSCKMFAWTMESNLCGLCQFHNRVAHSDTTHLHLKHTILWRWLKVRAKKALLRHIQKPQDLDKEM